MRWSVIAAVAAVSLAALTGCTPQRQSGGPASHPNLIVVREFSFSPGVITLDPSFGFSLYRGSPGVPPRQRAETVGRAAAFNLADRIAQELSRLGYDAVRSDAGGAEAGGRALIVTGAFQRIYEGQRRQNASIAAAVEVDHQSAGAMPQRLASFALDSQRLPRRPLVGVSARQGNDVNYAAALLADAIARYVAELARTNRWPGAAR